MIRCTNYAKPVSLKVRHKITYILLKDPQLKPLLLRLPQEWCSLKLGLFFSANPWIRDLLETQKEKLRFDSFKNWKLKKELGPSEWEKWASWGIFYEKDENIIKSYLESKKHEISQKPTNQNEKLGNFLRFWIGLYEKLRLENQDYPKYPKRTLQEVDHWYRTQKDMKKLEPWLFSEIQCLVNRNSEINLFELELVPWICDFVSDKSMRRALESKQKVIETINQVLPFQLSQLVLEYRGDRTTKIRITNIIPVEHEQEQNSIHFSSFPSSLPCRAYFDSKNPDKVILLQVQWKSKKILRFSNLPFTIDSSFRENKLFLSKLQNLDTVTLIDCDSHLIWGEKNIRFPSVKLKDELIEILLCAQHLQWKQENEFLFFWKRLLETERESWKSRLGFLSVELATCVSNLLGVSVK
jgi:hypothetical protein